MVKTKNTSITSFRSIFDFQKAKQNGQKISMLSVYDAITARIAIDAGVNTLLVGDSVAMVVYGFDSTIHATLEMMEVHTAAVRRSCPDTFIVGDLPFGSFRRSRDTAMDAVERLIRAGADAVKIEGVRGNEHIIAHIIESGIPVMGHLGLTPQSVLGLGGYKVQGNTDDKARQLTDDARRLQDLGSFSIILECVTKSVASLISSQLTIPIIGIGAGNEVDGQVLVASDMLGFSSGPKPRFVRHYMNGEHLISSAFKELFNDIQGGGYPTNDESYL